MNAYYLLLKMQPFGKARPRCLGKRPPYMPTEYKKKIQEVRNEAAKLNLPDGPLKMILTIYHKVPSGWSKVNRAAALGKLCSRKPDIDNVAGAVMDAIFPDDSRVCQLVVQRIWATADAMDVAIFSLNEGEAYIPPQTVQDRPKSRDCNDCDG